MDIIFDEIFRALGYLFIAGIVYLAWKTASDNSEGGKYKAVLWRSKIININQQPVSIGLKQKDGSWEMQEVEAEQFTLEFSLKNALIKNNRLEFIMSLPEIFSDKQIFIENINLEFNK